MPALVARLWPGPGPHLERFARRVAADLADGGCSSAPGDEPDVTVRVPESPSRWARVGRGADLLIRRLVRAVRLGPEATFPEVGPPEPFAMAWSGPALWVQDGYTAGERIVDLRSAVSQSGPTSEVRTKRRPPVSG
jgi:hypothetical protein